MITTSFPAKGTTDAVYLDILESRGPSSHILQTNGSGVNLTNYRTVGDDVPNYRRAIKAGESATTFLEAEKLSAHTPSGAQLVLALRKWQPTLKAYDYRTYILKGHIQAPGSISVPALDSDRLESIDRACRQVFMKRIIAAQRTLQSLVSLGELPETLRMIRHPLKSLFSGCYDYLNDVKKRRKRKRGKKGGKTTKEVIADTWLEYSFGWQPLVNDIQSAAEALAKVNVGNSALRKRVSATIKDEVSGDVSVTESKNYPGVSPIFEVTSVAETMGYVSVRYTGSVRLETSLQGYVNNVFGLRLRDLVPSLWELIPYSFLVDYFTNVGNLLENFSIQSDDLGWGERGICSSSTRTWYCTPNIQVNIPAGYDVIGRVLNVGPELFVNRRYVKRYAIGVGDLSVPLQFKIPGIGSNKWLNIAALIASSKRTSSQLSAY